MRPVRRGQRVPGRVELPIIVVQIALVASDLVAIRTQRLLRAAQLREILFELRRIAALQVLPNGVPILVDRLHLAAHGAHRTVQSLTSLPHGLRIALHCARAPLTDDPLSEEPPMPVPVVPADGVPPKDYSAAREAIRAVVVVMVMVVMFVMMVIMVVIAVMPSGAAAVMPAPATSTAPAASASSATLTSAVGQNLDRRQEQRQNEHQAGRGRVPNHG